MSRTYILTAGLQNGIRPSKARALAGEHVADGVGHAGGLVVDHKLKAFCANELNGLALHIHDAERPVGHQNEG